MNEEDFHCCCRLLLQRSEQLSDGWRWERVQGSEEGYLKKTVLRSVSAAWSPAQKQEGTASDSDVSTCSIFEAQPPESRRPAPADSDAGEDEDDICVLSAGSSRVLQYEYHVLYSCSYSAPVLYFRAFTLEGRSLTLDEVWGSVHPNFKHRLQHSPLNTVAQQEHPLLGQPFFVLHPCRTEELMRPVLQAAQEQHRPVNYVLSWLSMVGPVVGLDIPLKYSTQLHVTA